MFCKSCGKQIADGAKFCAYCGKETGISGTTVQNQPTQKQNAAYKNRETVHRSANERTRQSLLQESDNFLPETTFAGIGMVLAKILMLISLFVPNTGESRFYESINGFIRQFGLDLPETLIVMPIWENLLVQLGRGTIDGWSILVFMVLPVFAIIMLWISAVCIISTAQKRGKLTIGIRLFGKRFGFTVGVFCIYLAAVLIIACHIGRFEMYGAGYKLLAVGAVINLLCAGIDCVLAEKEIQRRLK